MKFHLSAGLVLSAIAVLGASVFAPAQAAPVGGPSAKAAAKLKKNPRTQWLAHYLPDDRYKIAGKVWMYVSTNLDTYYHRPDSPNMMRQPNSGVIGFASARAAEEAGYKPDPTDGTLSQVRGKIEAQQQAREQADIANGGARTFVKPSGKVILGDGRSTITIPPGWQRIASNQNNQGGSNFSIDLILHRATGKAVMLLTMTVPNVNVGRQLSSGNFASNIKRFGTAVNSTGQISNSGVGRTGDVLNNAKVSRTKWGGLNGVVLTMPAKSGGGNLIIVGKGNKAYMFQAVGKGKTPPNASAMIKSFRPR